MGTSHRPPWRATPVTALESPRARGYCGQAQATWTDTGSEDVICSLQAGGKIEDSANQTIVDGATGTLNPIATVTTTGSSTSVQIACTFDPKLTIGTNLAIIAIPLAALN